MWSTTTPLQSSIEIDQRHQSISNLQEDVGSLVEAWIDLGGFLQVTALKAADSTGDKIIKGR